ncbi:DUF58 domain-containing protein [Marinobacter sp.]|uniref:DUF58 domain-containing protein n=1 Tax=Marinobacter sp. TaxID=50741 RepID=UPI00384E4406
MTAVLKRRWTAWVNRRIPRTDSQRFEQRNIFILPSGAGVVFGILLLIMLITGINYQNSLIYLLTFMLGAVFVAAMHQTHANLSGVGVTLVRAGEGFAGEDIAFTLRLATAARDAIAIELTPDSRGEKEKQKKPEKAAPAPEIQTIPAGEIRDLSLTIPSTKRGPLALDRVRVETRFPFGLLFAWSWMRPESSGLVYPRPVTPPQAITPEMEGDESVASHPAAGHEHAELRPWRQGDMVQRVQWKRYARTGEMVIADWEGEQGSPQWLDYGSFPGADTELRLSYLAAQVLDRESAGRLFGLRLPGQIIDPDQGASHVRRCLRALALFGIKGESAEAMS